MIYADHVQAYLDAGWQGVLPLPPGSKGPPPEGFTGYQGVWPTETLIIQWRKKHPDANIGLRLPKGVIGIDVDAYAGKPGAKTLEDLEVELGPLPPTWVITSRDDGVSGIRLYRVSGGFDFAPPSWHSPGPGIDVIHFGHRYVVAPPSVHPEGGTYRWVKPHEVSLGHLVESKLSRPVRQDELAKLGEYVDPEPGKDLPSPGDLPELP